MFQQVWRALSVLLKNYREKQKKKFRSKFFFVFFFDAYFLFLSLSVFLAFIGNRVERIFCGLSAWKKKNDGWGHANEPFAVWMIIGEK
jgi:hypothetical protein